MKEVASLIRESLVASNKTYKPLTIIVGTYNRLTLLKQCLEALRGCNQIETVIVTDAGSKDGTIEYLFGRTDIRLVCDEKPIGQAKSFNRILPMVRSRYVGWISDDNVVQRGALDDAVQILDENKDIGMVGLKVRDKTGPYAKHPYLGAVWPSGVLTVNQGVLRTDLLLKLGGFDEEFNDYGMDIDLTTRVLLSGYKVALTKCVAIHHYRDHQTSNWIDEEGRRRRIASAKELYRQRFSQLIDYCGRLRIPLKSKVLEHLKWRLGTKGRDFRNIVLAKYISPLDLVKNWNRKYHLVQSIPSVIIKKANCNLVSIKHNDERGEGIEILKVKTQKMKDDLLMRDQEIQRQKERAASFKAKIDERDEKVKRLTEDV